MYTFANIGHTMLEKMVAVSVTSVPYVGFAATILSIVSVSKNSTKLYRKVIEDNLITITLE